MSNVIKLSGEVKTPNDVEAELFLDEFTDWLQAKGYSFGGGVEDASVHDATHAPHVHYHCDLCGNRFDTQAEADACFEGHTREEHLEWIAQETYYLHTCSRQLYGRMDLLNQKYGLD